jgi:hypothetical protein
MGLDLNDTGEVVNGIPKRAPYDSSALQGHRLRGPRRAA